MSILFHHHLMSCDFIMMLTLIDDVHCIGVPEASMILLKAEKDYPDSAIFQYFKGRVLSLQV